MRRRRVGLWSVVVVLALFAAACSNSGDDGGTEAGGESTPAPTDAPDESSGGGESTDDPETTDAPETTDDPEMTDEPVGDEPDRTTFVPIEGVPGVSDTEIATAVLGLRSNNPLGTCILDCYLTGIQAYFDYQNSLGGVFGRELVVGEVLDDEFVQNQPKALEIIANEDSFAAFGATLNPAGYQDLQDAGVPTFVWGIQAPALNGNDHLFGHLAALCADCTGRSVPYEMAFAGATRAVTLGYGVSPESQTCSRTLAESIELYGEDLGIEVVKIYDELAFGLPNGIAPEVSEWNDLDVDFVATCMDLNGMKTIAQELVRQGLRDQITMHHPNTYDQPFVAEAEGIFDGDFVLIQFVPFEYSDSPQIQLYDEWVQANGGQTAEQTMVGWINASLFVDGLIAAGPEFDRDSVVNTINTTFTAYTAGGLHNPIDWSRQHDSPTPDDRVSNGFVEECTALVQMQGEGFVTITDEPFVCWPTDDLAWQEPVETTFE